MSMRKLLNEVSMNELMRMRDEGMTNQEIADSLDVSSMTIYRIIGAQPKGVTNRGKYKRGGDSVVRDVPKKQEEEVVPACLVTINRTIELQGATAKYELNVEQKTVCVNSENEKLFSSMVLNVDELDTFIEGLNTFAKELQTIQRKVATFNSVEAW